MHEEAIITEGGDTNKNDVNWKMYELLVGHLQHCHSRLVDNYRVFLTFNSLLIPAVTALLAYILKNKDHLEDYEMLLLRLAVIVICGIGFYVTWQGAGLVRRVIIDSEIRINQLTRLEKAMKSVTVSPFIEGGEFFFQGKTLPSGIPNKKDLSLSDYGKSTRAIEAYKHSSYAIYLAYTLLAIFSLSPVLARLFVVMSKIVQCT
jgi:hypothetical protein